MVPQRDTKQGYTQIYGIDYVENISFGSKDEYNLSSFTIGNQFWADPTKKILFFMDLKEQIYIEVPLGFESKKIMVCKLKKGPLWT